MNADTLMSLGENDLFLFLLTMGLCFARIMGFFVQAPIWGSKHIMTPIKMGMLILLTVIVWPNVQLPREIPGGPPVFIVLVITQILVGLVLGFVAFIPMAMAQFGGELMDIQMGLSSAAASDPSSKGTINLIRRFKFYIAMILLMMVNGHHVLIKVIVKSFEVIPLTGIRFSYTLIQELIVMTGSLFYVGVQIGLPVIGALFMVQIALGIMAKVAPQMNVFMLSFPINIITGLTMIITALPIFFRRMLPLFDENIDLIVEVIKLMRPL